MPIVTQMRSWDPWIGFDHKAHTNSRREAPRNIHQHRIQMHVVFLCGKLFWCIYLLAARVLHFLS
jgi:hypothetical protein